MSDWLLKNLRRLYKTKRVLAVLNKKIDVSHSG